MKKLLSVVLGTVLVASALPFAACTDRPAASAEDGWENQTGTLSILSSNPEFNDVMADIIDDFEKENSGIIVNFEAVPTAQYANLLNSRFNADDVDIFAHQPASNLGNATNMERNQPLTSDNPEYKFNITDNISQVYIDECSYDGTMYIAPASVGQNVVFYKKDFMTQYFNDTGKSIPKTWDEFIALLDYMKADGKYITYGGKDLWPFAMIAAQFEATIVRPEISNLFKEVAVNDLKFAENEYTIEMFEKLSQLMNQSNGYFRPNSTGFEYSAAPGSFITDPNAAFTIDGSWSLKQMRDADPSVEIGVFLLPGNDDASKNVNYPGKVASGWAVGKSSQNKALAKKFLEYFYSDEVYSYYCEQLYVQSVKDTVSVDDPVIEELSTVPTIITIDNRIVAKMPYDTYMKETVGPGFYNGTLTVADALKEIDSKIAADEPLWSKEVESFLIKCGD